MFESQTNSLVAAMDENEVIRILASGQVTQQVYDWFFKKFYPVSVNLARQFSVPVSDAVNILVEVTGKTIMELSSTPPRVVEHLYAFVRKALYNQMCNYLRSKGRHNLVELDATFKQFAEIPEEAEDEEKEALIARMYHCIDKLPSGEREPLRLWHLEERTYEEISALLRIAKKSAKTFVNRGMTKLRICMSNNSTQQQ